MNTLLTETLECIAIESGDFDKSFGLVDRLIEDYGEADLTQRLYADIDQSVPWEIVADLFSILIWSTSDNGTSLTDVTEQWITECDDERKIAIALNIDVYPFISEIEMINKLKLVADNFPNLKQRCMALIFSRTKNQTTH